MNTNEDSCLRFTSNKRGVRPVIAASVATLLLLVQPVYLAVRAATALNLSSTIHSVTTPGAAIINVGGHSMSIQQGQLVTPAEAVAISQILQTGHQQLVLGVAGNAIRGMLDINNSAGAYSSITIPRGVTALDNFTNSSLILSGDYTNAGRFYAYSTSPASSSATIQALDIINEKGGLISSSLPVGNFGLSNVISSLDLDLAASNNFINHGTIVSSGNINIASLNANNLTINNAGGTIQALGQNINIDNTQFSQNSNVTLIGGNWLSNQLNVNSANGSIVIDVDKISGLLNAQGSSVFTQAATPNLQLGAIDATADPTFYNTAGNISITSSFPVTAANESLALVASGNISSSGGSISTAVIGGNAGSITMIAGAKFTTNGPGSVLPPAAGDTSSTLRITGASPTGGQISLNSITALNSSSTVAGGNGNGGDITLVAFAGSSSGSGVISLPSSVTVTSTGSGTGSNGNVTMIAGANTGTALSVGAINANGGGTTTGGNIGLFVAKPLLTNVTITDGSLGAGSTISAGSLTKGSMSFVAPTSNPVNVTAGGTFNASSGGAIDTTKAAITSGSNATVLSSGSTVTTGAITSSNGTMSISAGDTLTLAKPITAEGNITLATTAKNANILIEANVVSSAGSVTATANGTGSIEDLNQVITKVGLGGSIGSQFPVGAAPTPDGKFVFVPDYQTNEIYVISTGSDSVIQTFSDPSLSKPQGTAIAPGGGTLYVANYGSHTITVITYDALTGVATLAKTLTIPTTAGTPEALAVSPDGKTLYVMSDQGLALGNAGFVTPSSEFFTKVDIATGTTSTVALGTSLEQTGGVVINPQGTTAWVTDSGTKSVSVINLTTSTPTVIKTIDLSSFGASNPISLAIDPNGSRIYVSEGSLDRSLGGGFLTGAVAIINALPTAKTFDTVIGQLDFANGTGNVGTFPQGITTNATGVEVFTQTTYGFSQSPNTTLLYANSSPQATIGIQTGTGTDGIGSSNWSTVVANGGINNLTTFTSDTYNFQGQPATVSVIQEPTIQGHNVSLTAGGFILGSYDARGGTLTANATGKTSQIILSNVGNSASFIGNSKSTGLFEIGSLQNLTVSGNIVSPNVMLQATANNSNIQIGSGTTAAKIGQTGGTVLISSNGTGTITQGNAVSSVVGATVTLNTAGGDIGAAGAHNAINTVTPDLGITTLGNAFVSNTGAVTIGPSNAASLNLTNAGTITYSSTGPINAATINLTTTTGSIIIDAALGAGIGTSSAVTLMAGGTGGITQAPGTSQISADTVSVIAAKGSIGSASQPIRTTTSTLAVNTAGQATITNAGDVSIGGQFNGSSLTLTDTGAITVPALGGIVAKSITLNATGGAASNINLGASIGAAGATVVLTATGGVSQTAGSISAGSLVIKTQSGDIGSSLASIQTDATSLSVAGVSNHVFINDTSTGTVTLSNATKTVNYATFDLTTAGALVSNAVLNGVSDSLTSSNGNVILNAQMNGINDTVDAGGNITCNAGITGQQATLDAGDTATNGNGGIMISKGIVVGNGSVGGTTVTLIAHGTGTIMNTTSSGVITDSISATTDKGDIGSSKVPFLFITLNLTANSASGSANLLDVGTGVSLGLGGSIGGSAALNTKGSSLNCSSLTVGPAAASTDTTGGHNLTIIQDGGSQSGTGGVTISGPVTVTNGNISITQLGSGGLSTSAAGVISTGGTTKATIGGNISLVNQGAGALTVNGNVSAINGSIVLQESDTATGAINLGTGAATAISATVSGTAPAGAGQVTIVIGKLPVTAQNGGQSNFPTGVTVTPTGGGNAFAGSHPGAIVFAAAGDTASLTATGANIVFNSPSTANRITFGNNLSITADPPVPAVVPSAHVVLPARELQSIGGQPSDFGVSAPAAASAVQRTAAPDYTTDHASLFRFSSADALVFSPAAQQAPSVNVTDDSPAANHVVDHDRADGIVIESDEDAN